MSAGSKQKTGVVTAPTRDPPILFKSTNQAALTAQISLQSNGDSACYPNDGTATARHAYIEVLEGRGREDVHDLHHVLVVEVPQQTDLPHDALRIH